MRQGTLLSTCRVILINKIDPHRLPIGDNYRGDKALIYENHRKDDGFWHCEHEVMGKILRTLPDGIKVLDVPFGTGRFVPLYLQKHMSISGIDSSNDMIRQSEASLGDKFVLCDVDVGDAKKLPYKEEQFDLVVCFRFLPWVVSFRDAKVILKEIIRVCKSHAIIEFCVGNSARSGKRPSEKAALWNQLNEAELSQLLSSVGFKTISVVPIFDDDDNPGLTAFVCEKPDNNPLRIN